MINVTMKHMPRVHRIPIAWLHAIFRRAYLNLFYEVTANMCADIYTGAFNENDKWEYAGHLINICDPAILADALSLSTECVFSTPLKALVTVRIRLP